MADVSIPIDLSQLEGVGIGLALGLLVGIQRGWSQRARAAGTRFAGIRTFGLLGLAGGIAGTLYDYAQGAALILLAATAGLVVVGYLRTSTEEDRLSGTTSIAGLLTMTCGFVAATGDILLGTTVTVAMVLLLALRVKLHSWLRHLSEQEELAIARFAVIALVILPLLPNAYYGPYSAWNPRLLWSVVVMVSGFSFAGYFAAKWLGATRGTFATAAAGSMVSSTAVTASLATRMREGDGDTNILASAISAASVVMFIRVLILVGVLSPFALGSLAILVTPAALVSLAIALWFLHAARNGEHTAPCRITLKNPFDLKPALLLTAMVMVFTVVARWALATWGHHGLALVLAISGTVDVDSAIITMGSLPKGTLDPAIGGLVIAIPAALNTLFKGTVAVSITGWRLGKLGALPLIATAVTIGLTWAVITYA